MSRQTLNFTVDPGWQVLFKDLGLSTQDVLRKAQLPLDLFKQEVASLSAEDYYRLYDGLGELMDNPAFPLVLGQSVSAEAFSPPLFACFCSTNLNVAMTRLAQYKPLLCPMRLTVKIDDQSTKIGLTGVPQVHSPPCSVIASELVFFVQIARLATREHIVPLEVCTTEPLPETQQYERYFGVSVTQGKGNTVTFSAGDARRPFLTANDALWAIFEPNLRMRLEDLESDSQFSDRVRAGLMEILASGECSMNDVAKKLGVSTRTLQRRLQEEGTNFQTVLNRLREDLAVHYLTQSKYSNTEIAFLLGFDDPNSFFRAFQSWTGETPEAVRLARKTG